MRICAAIHHTQMITASMDLSSPKIFTSKREIGIGIISRTIEYPQTLIMDLTQIYTPTNVLASQWK